MTYVNALGSLPTMTRCAGWEFLIPQSVTSELRRKERDRQLEAMMYSGVVLAVSCTANELESVRRQSPGLGLGETEALGVVNRCADRTFKSYVILTDDKPAQKQATKMGMSSLDIVSFLFLANQKGAVSKRAATDALMALVDLKYSVSSNIQNDFLRRLR